MIDGPATPVLPYIGRCLNQYVAPMDREPLCFLTSGGHKLLGVVTCTSVDMYTHEEISWWGTPLHCAAVSISKYLAPVLPNLGYTGVRVSSATELLS